jgi:hypothetical protein
MIYSHYYQIRYEPEVQQRIQQFETYQNTTTRFRGEIIESDKTNQTMTVRLGRYPYSLIDIKTDNLEGNPEKNDYVEILGVLDDKNHITVEKILLIKRWQHDLIFIRSLPAIPFALYLFFRSWRFNTKTYQFERRKNHA